MRRRNFISGIGSAAIAWPLTARAQQQTMPVIGFLGAASAAEWAPFATAFRQGLREAGFIDGQNLAIQYRWSEYQYSRLPALANDLVGRQVRAIVAAGLVAAQAVKSATSTIPIVFVIGADPVKFALVKSLSRPDRNITGITFVVSALASKRLELLHQLIPTATVVGLLINPNSPSAESEKNDYLLAASTLGQRLQVVTAKSDLDFEPAFSALAHEGANALIVNADLLFTAGRNQLVALAARYAMPTIHPLREFATAGGLISYGTSIEDAYRKAGIYTAMVINGSKPSDLPVQQSSKFELVINLKTAKTLNLTVPQVLLAQADEVIE